MPPASNRRIVNAAWLAAGGKLPGAPRTPGKCPAFVWVVVKFALNWHSYDLFASYLEANTTRRPRRDAKSPVEAHPDPWANHNVAQRPARRQRQRRQTLLG